MDHYSSVNPRDFRDAGGEPLEPARLCRQELLVAGRQALPQLHPLDQGRLGVADGPAELDVGGTVAAHARFCQPGQAHVQVMGCFLGSEQNADGPDRMRGVAGAFVATVTSLVETLISGLCVSIPSRLAWPRQEFDRSEDMTCLLFRSGCGRRGPLLGRAFATRYENQEISGAEDCRRRVSQKLE